MEDKAPNVTIVHPDDSAAATEETSADEPPTGASLSGDLAVEAAHEEPPSAPAIPAEAVAAGNLQWVETLNDHPLLDTDTRSDMELPGAPPIAAITSDDGAPEKLAPAAAKPKQREIKAFGNNDDYDIISTLGEGAYGVVLKAKTKATGRLVAIKRFRDSDSEDKYVRKTALREVKLLKKLTHVNIVELIIVYRYKNKLNLVLEFVDRTLVDDLGMDALRTRLCTWQVLRAVGHMHAHGVVHRDISPKNVLMSHEGVVKLCDFGFARPLGAAEDVYTGYVGQRWYRAPELLTRQSYGAAVDVWAIGVMLPEVHSGPPLFPGKSEVDQFFLINACLGAPPPEILAALKRLPHFEGVEHISIKSAPQKSLPQRFPRYPPALMRVLTACLVYEPSERATCEQLLALPYFVDDGLTPSVTDDEVPRLIERALAGPLAGKKRGGGGGGGADSSAAPSRSTSSSACAIL